MIHSHSQNMIPTINMNQTFLTQQHGQSAPVQSHNLNRLTGTNQSVSFLQNAHPNGPFPSQLARVRSDNRQRDMLTQTQRATSGGAQTGLPTMNGVVPTQPPGVGYPGMVSQNGQGSVQRVASQPLGVGAPLTSPHPSSHPVGMNNPGLGLTGGLQTQRPGPQSQPQTQMAMRAGQPSLPGQPGVGQIRPQLGMSSIPPGGIRGPGGMSVNMGSGMMGNVPQQTQQQQGFPNSLGMGGPGPQPPPQGPQGPANSMSQPMHRPLSSSEGTNTFGAMPGFPGSHFSQGGPHPPTNHMSGLTSANQFFMPPAPSPSQHIDMTHSLSSGGAGPSSTSPTRPDFTLTPAQYVAHGSGVSSGSNGSNTNEGFSQTFSTHPHPLPRPPSSSHPALGPPHQQAQSSQGLSHPTPPRQQTPHQQSHISPAHLPDRFSAPIPNPTRPQSQPQRPSSQQRMGQSPTPHPPTRMSGGPPPRPTMGTGVGTGPPPLVPVSSAENGDLSRQPGVPGIRPPMSNHAPTIGLGQALMRVLQLVACSRPKTRNPKNYNSHIGWAWWTSFFLASATLKLTLWKDNQKVEAKVFGGTPVLPRFFLVTSQSGVKSMTLSLDGARERVVGSNHAVVQCVSAMWTYRYHNGYTVTLRDHLRHMSLTAPQRSLCHTQPFLLKIDHIQFDSNLYEKHVAVDVIGGNRLDANKTPQVRNAPTPSPTMNGVGVPPPLPQPPQPPPAQAGQRDDERWEEPRITYERAFIPAEPVNAFGIPQATMRCLELAESVAQMTDLMQYSHDIGVGPLDTLKQFAQKLREMPPHTQGQFFSEGMSAGPSTHSLYTPNMSSTAPSSAQITPATIPQRAPSTGSPASSPDKGKGTPQQAHAPNPTAPPSAGSSTPSMMNAQLKRKGGGGETSSPTTSNAETSSAASKRNPRKRGRT
ncbi:LIM-domain binding protein-domain-containing protein [Lactarius vividus]|nr:LIM-domain binding protein-domain-containing protein [Lactarius vividus]